jgi:hypothetical protein
MAYPPYRSDRRSKVRRWLLIAFSLVVIIALIAVIASRQTEQRGTAEFFTAADEAAGIHEVSSVAFGETLASIGVMTRQDLTRRLSQIVEAASEADALMDIGAPSSIGSSYGTFITSTASWLDGATEVERVILGIMDGAIVETAVADLQRSLDQLRVGDVAYGRFTDSLVETPNSAEIPDFQPIEYIALEESDPLRFNATNLVLRIQSAYSLSPHRDVSVSGMTDPEPVGERAGVPIIPFADKIGINALVTNAGNEDEGKITVDLEVFEVNADVVVTRTEVVDDLAAGASTTVLFDDLEIAAGGLFQAKLTVTVSGDINAENDVWELVFIWNAES